MLLPFVAGFGLAVALLRDRTSECSEVTEPYDGIVLISREQFIANTERRGRKRFGRRGSHGPMSRIGTSNSRRDTLDTRQAADRVPSQRLRRSHGGRIVKRPTRSGHLQFGLGAVIAPIPGSFESDQETVSESPEDNDAPEETSDVYCSDDDHQKGLEWLLQTEEGPSKGGILGDDPGPERIAKAIALISSRPCEMSSCKTTLIVTACDRIDAWVKEINDHPELSCAIYDNAGAGMAWQDLSMKDMVICTYDTLQEDFRKKMMSERALLTGDPRDGFHRCILDEAQTLFGDTVEASRKFQAALEVTAEYRLCMTATPDIDNLNNLFSLTHFLSIGNHRSRRIDNTAFVQSRGESDLIGRRRATMQLRDLCKDIIYRTKKPPTSDPEVIDLENYEPDAEVRFGSLIQKHLQPLLDNAANLLPECQEFIKRFGGLHTIIECPVCLTEIEDEADVMIIPCGHEICSACLRGLCQSDASSKCHMCRKEFEVTDITDLIAVRGTPEIA